MMHSAVPKNVVGVLAPASSKWAFGIIEYSDPGYVKDPGTAHLDEEAVLGDIRHSIEQGNSQSGAQGSSAEWVLKPAYDAAGNKLEWAVRAGNGREVRRSSITRSASLAGRRCWRWWRCCRTSRIWI